MNFLVVISYWTKRPIFNLINLINQLMSYDQDNNFSICVVCNDSDAQNQNELKKYINTTFNQLLYKKPSKINNIYLEIRTNSGMNIGAWNYGWRLHSNYDYFLFLQDEVVIQKQNWLQLLLNCINYYKLNNNSYFLLGESWNYRWDVDWDILINGAINIYMDGHPSNIKRVNYYLNKLEYWGIERGNTGGHLRSLIWMSNRKTLESINGFREGKSLGECIAVEISISKAVKQRGGIVCQFHKTPFEIFWHLEWRKDGVSKL